MTNVMFLLSKKEEIFKMPLCKENKHYFLVIPNISQNTSQMSHSGAKHIFKFLQSAVIPAP